MQVIIDHAGIRLAQCDPEARIAQVCPCGRANVHRVKSLQRGFLPIVMLEWVTDALANTKCKLGRPPEHCHMELVTPDDGCSEEG